MKATDDYEAKLDFWARHPRVCALPRPVGLPRFGSKRPHDRQDILFLEKKAAGPK